MMQHESDPAVGSNRFNLKRRHFVAMAGASAIGATFPAMAFGSRASADPISSGQDLFGQDLSGQGSDPVIVQRQGIVVQTDAGFKPVYLAEEGTQSAAVLSLAENLFWNDIIMEHALFMQLHMPGPDLAQHRQEALQLQKKFERQFSLAATTSFDGDGYIHFNRSTVAILDPIIAFKRRMQKAQASGKIRSLAWPSFFAHIADEAERFKLRLERLSSGIVDMVAEEEGEFWRDTMGEHAGFIAHLLEPTEKALIAKAKGFEELYSTLDPSDISGILSATHDIIEFKTAAAHGIAKAEIASIIHPALADHVRREAIKAKADLSRL